MLYFRGAKDDHPKAGYFDEFVSGYRQAVYELISVSSHDFGFVPFPPGGVALLTETKLLNWSGTTHDDSDFVCAAAVN